MKAILFYLAFLLVIIGCSSSQDTASKKKMQVTSAIYEHWSEPPPPNSDIPERGTDIVITVSNWPTDYTPNYIVYNQRKSLSTSIADTSQNKTVISARIVRSSSILIEPSESVSVSDRLVYSTGEGTEKFIEIKDWQSANKN